MLLAPLLFELVVQMCSQLNVKSVIDAYSLYQCFEDIDKMNLLLLVLFDGVEMNSYLEIFQEV